LKFPYLTSFQENIYDTPLNSLIDSTARPNVKTTEGKGVGVRSLTHNTLGVEGCAEEHARALKWGLR
jgi:hypothetical protein